MLPLISDDLRDALIEQIAEEFYNSNFYLRIAVFLESKGLKYFPKFYRDAHEEEHEHGMQIVNFLSDMNVDFAIPPVMGVSVPLERFVDVALAGYDREVDTTKSLIAIKNLAIEEDCGILEELMRKMIRQQRSEMAEAYTVLDQAEFLGGDWKAVLLLDASLGE